MTTRTLNLETPDGRVECGMAIPEDGFGLGIIVVGGTPSVNAELTEEGYVVLALDPATALDDEGTIGAAANSLRPSIPYMIWSDPSDPGSLQSVTRKFMNCSASSVNPRRRKA